jgi:zinc/manganese transport system permease protein
VTAVLAAIALGVTLVLYRPLVLSSLSSDLAAARGIPVRLVGLAYLLVLAVAVSLSAIAIGAILSTALLIGPPAAALRLVKRTGAAMLAATLLGVGATCLGVLLAYDSASWTSSHSGWPVSFFVVAIVFLLYLLAQLVASVRGTHRPAAPAPEGA